MTRAPVPILSVLRLNARARLAKYVAAAGPDECWLFTGQKNKRGYGFVPVMVKGKRYPILAHRLAWVLEHGREVPDGKLICHRCSNASCCNPKHLYAGTQQDNMNDMVKAGRAAATLTGITGAAHPRASYTQAQRDEVIRRRQQGEPLAVIHSATGVNCGSISRWWREWLESR